VVVGAAVILFDPIFQGLALSLMAGEIASLLISRIAVPVLYEMAARRTQAHERAAEHELARTNAESVPLQLPG
jgi:multidrug efflux pump subunit AcrB